MSSRKKKSKKDKTTKATTFTTKDANNNMTVLTEKPHKSTQVLVCGFDDSDDELDQAIFVYEVEDEIYPEEKILH